MTVALHPRAISLASGRWGSPAGFVDGSYVFTAENVLACRAYWARQILERGSAGACASVSLAVSHVGWCDKLLTFLRLTYQTGAGARRSAKRQRAARNQLLREG